MEIKSNPRSGPALRKNALDEPYKMRVKYDKQRNPNHDSFGTLNFLRSVSFCVEKEKLCCNASCRGAGKSSWYPDEEGG